MGRDPGPLLGAVERLRRAHEDAVAEGDKPALAATTLAPNESPRKQRSTQ